MSIEGSGLGVEGGVRIAVAVMVSRGVWGCDER